MKKYLFGAAATLFMGFLFIPLSAFAAPVIEEFYPEDDATGVLRNEGGSIFFDQDVVVGTGNITLYKASDNTVVETLDVTDSDVVEVDGTEVYLYTTVTLDFDTEYYFLIDAGAFEDEAEDPFAGIADPTTWSFTTRSPLGLPTYTFERVSVGDAGQQGSGGSNLTYSSPDDRYIVFSSANTNFTEEGTGGRFIRDMEGETLTYLSYTYADLSLFAGDGRYLVFDTSDVFFPGDTNDTIDTFIYDRTEDSVVRASINGVTESTGPTYAGAVSDSGRFVLLKAFGTELVENDVTNFVDIYLYDSTDGSIELVSVGNDEQQGNNNSADGAAVSNDGRYIAFISVATNLTEDVVSGQGALFLRDRQEGTTVLVADYVTAIDGAGIRFSGDNNHLVFVSFDDALLVGTRGVLSYDIQTDTLVFISDYASYASVSFDGRYIAYQDDASDHINRYDTETEEVLVVTEGADGEGGYVSSSPLISNDGTKIVFYSQATNLVDDDTNGEGDVFFWDESIQVEEPEEEPVVEEEESGRSSSHRRSTPTTSETTVPDAQDSEDEIMSLQIKLIELLKQLLAELMAAH